MKEEKEARDGTPPFPLRRLQRHRYAGYKPTVYYPRSPSKQLYKNLVTQCEKMGIAFLSYIPSDDNQSTNSRVHYRKFSRAASLHGWMKDRATTVVRERPQRSLEQCVSVKILESSYDLIVDALFGFGFRPPLKPDFAETVQRIASLKVPLASIDVPSGWDVGEKTETTDLLQPDCLISLTAPKLCAHRFTGRFHFLGGRFVPPLLADKYNLCLPPYPGASPVVLLKGPQLGDLQTPNKFDGDLSTFKKPCVAAHCCFGTTTLDFLVSHGSVWYCVTRPELNDFQSKALGLITVNGCRVQLQLDAALAITVIL
ncbi:hypothetical protein EGR_06343 [Echinococcus granulosus]|uniref:NAD(P)H-hydrate epimerase n=1 Tax=Echinococcus granulosus TaxID=6210 RepID=W6UYY5_ECHGR|nr:hypothetical protein EGR_06343 [Echinococcus granulosus]EUB58794.1 hypothetical protein EGR_06343 [Echinococcus granulosus]